MEKLQKASAISPDEELLTAGQAYEYFLPKSPVLKVVRPSFEAEHDASFANSSFAAKRDLIELFPGLNERSYQDLIVFG